MTIIELPPELQPDPSCYGTPDVSSRWPGDEEYAESVRAMLLAHTTTTIRSEANTMHESLSDLLAYFTVPSLAEHIDGFNNLIRNPGYTMDDVEGESDLYANADAHDNARDAAGKFQPGTRVKYAFRINRTRSAATGKDVLDHFVLLFDADQEKADEPFVIDGRTYDYRNQVSILGYVKVADRAAAQDLIRRIGMAARAERQSRATEALEYLGGDVVNTQSEADAALDAVS